MKNLKKVIVIALFSLAVIALQLPMMSFADGGKGSISLKFDEIENISFRLYRVARPDGNDNYTMIGDFAELPQIDLFEKSAAETLKQYVVRDQIQPTQVVATDENGSLTYESLEVGAYLILGDDFTQNGKRYTINPMLLSIPYSTDEETGSLVWDVEINVKYTSKEVTDIKVQKVWDDNNDLYDLRPMTVTAQLSNDEGLYEEVELSKDCNWSYEWKDLDASKTWSVTEKEVFDDYEVSIESQNGGKVVIIKNSIYFEDETETETYHDPETEPASETETESEPQTETIETHETETESETTVIPPKEDPPKKLPQTGQLWWPVAIMLCLALVSTIIGLRIKE